MSNLYELKLRNTIKKDFEILYPDYEFVKYEFNFTRYRKAVKITYGNISDTERQLEWDYVSDLENNWVNYDSAMISRDTIIVGTHIIIDEYKDL